MRLTENHWKPLKNTELTFIILHSTTKSLWVINLKSLTFFRCVEVDAHRGSFSCSSSWCDHHSVIGVWLNIYVFIGIHGYRCFIQGKASVPNTCDWHMLGKITQCTQCGVHVDCKLHYKSIVYSSIYVCIYNVCFCLSCRYMYITLPPHFRVLWS